MRTRSRSRPPSGPRWPTRASTSPRSDAGHGDVATQRLLGLYVRFGDRIDLTANRSVHRLAAALADDVLPGVTDLVPGYASLYVEYDAATVDKRVLERWIERRARDPSAPPPVTRSVELPTVYEGDDLSDLASNTGLDVPDVVRRHASVRYHVHAVGFTAGFAYMAEVDPRIRVPRRSVPRRRVPSGTVAMADAQTGVYAVSSPSGWHLLGRTLVSVYDPCRPEPFLLAPGDRVRFVPATGTPPDEGGERHLLPERPHHPVLRVQEPGLLDLVVDRGRAFGGRYGLVRSGALDPRSAALATRLVGSVEDDPLIEFSRTGGSYEALSDAVLAFAGYGLEVRVEGERVPTFSSFLVRAGQRLDIAPTREERGCRAYLAVAGGFEAQPFFGSASPDLRGRIGRPLKAGDLLGTRRDASVVPGRHFRPYRRSGPVTTLGILAGPQPSHDAFAALTRETFTVTHADRTGLVLNGPEPISGGGIVSEGVPIGAIQVTSGGVPIVLLADRGTLGGYTKPAVLHPDALPEAAQLREGDRVRFWPIHGRSHVWTMDLSCSCLRTTDRPGG